MAPKREQKRLGKKHRKATTRPKQGKAPRAGAKTGAQIAGAAPKQRKTIAAKTAAKQAAAHIPKRSPELERKVSLAQSDEDKYIVGRPKKFSLGGAGSSHAQREDRELEHLASELMLATSNTGHHTPDRMPLVAICGRPNVGKSTLFNRLTGTRRSIVGDEPGITRDRIYGEVEWAGRTVRLVDTGGVIPDDEALIPAEIFRQAKVGLEEADAIVMVIDGRTEITAPDIELSRLLLRGGKPLFLAVNKMDTAELESSAENFRTLGFKNVQPISAEHNSGIGDLLDEVWAALPPEFVAEEPSENEEGFDQEFDEDMGPLLDDSDEEDDTESAPRERKLKSHGEHVQRETKIAIIGRPNVGKSTLLNALTGTERAIVSPIAGTTRDAVDEVVERDNHSFRFIDTAGIRRKGKTKLMAEKLSVIMSRKHLEDADVALLVIDATEGITALDANIGGYAHESGRSVIILVNKWDAMTKTGPDGMRIHDGKPPADKKVYEQQVRDSLKYLEYAPLLFISAMEELNIDQVFKKVELVARERRKRISTGNMNRFLDAIDFQRASVPMNKRVKIYYMTQAAVAPPTFVLFTDRDVKLHFSYERFLANEVRRAFKFIGSPIWFKIKARNKKKSE
ncbi:MAG: ribosome biogenesis GTPase Der [Acidobacteriaceae bacterium]|nr:ribosome biogenesis GTPase Der [Acidobacteriaceae bacterium]